jgi:hypothetical protein
MRDLKEINNASGKLYGWMSKHVHWNYEAHVKTINHDDTDGKTKTLLASSYFKAVCFCAMLVMLDILFDVARTLYSKFENKADNGEKRTLPLIKTAIIGFVEEIRSHDPSDIDLQRLARMIVI